MAEKGPISGQCGKRAPNPYPAHLIRLFLIVSLFELVPQRGYGQTASSEITSFRQLSQLSREEAAKGNPVRIKGTVLCYDAEWSQFYVQDDREAKYFNPRIAQTALQPGQK